MHLAADDAARRARKVWLGPEGFRWPWTWTYPQWAAGALTGVAALVATGLALSALIGSDGWLVFIDAGLAILMGFAVGALFGTLTAPLIDADQTPTYVLRQLGRVGTAIAWSRGPVDLVEVGLAAGLWLPLMILTPGPWLLRAPLLAAATWRFARYLVARFQSPQRHWARLMARAERRATPVAFEYRVQIPAFAQEETS